MGLMVRHPGRHDFVPLGGRDRRLASPLTLDRPLSPEQVRQRQLQQWAFAAEPGHPALLAAADAIALHVSQHSVLSASADRATLERTGPAPFTDAILRHWAQQARTI